MERTRPPFPYECDKNLRRLVEGDMVIYEGKSYIFLGLAEPLGMAAIGSENEPVYVAVQDLEIVV